MSKIFKASTTQDCLYKTLFAWKLTMLGSKRSNCKSYNDKARCLHAILASHNSVNVFITSCKTLLSLPSGPKVSVRHIMPQIFSSSSLMPMGSTHHPRLMATAIFSLLKEKLLNGFQHEISSRDPWEHTAFGWSYHKT